MLQRDYIMRLIQSFMDALAKFIRNKEGKDAEILRPELDKLYDTFLKQPRNYFHELTIEEIIDSFDNETKWPKVEIVAHLFYQDALVGEINKDILQKSLTLFRLVDLNSNTFSFDRQRKAMEIEEILMSISEKNDGHI